MIQKYVRKCQNVYQYQVRVMLTLCRFASIKATNLTLYGIPRCLHICQKGCVDDTWLVTYAGKSGTLNDPLSGAPSMMYDPFLKLY